MSLGSAEYLPERTDIGVFIKIIQPSVTVIEKSKLQRLLDSSSLGCTFIQTELNMLEEVKVNWKVVASNMSAQLTGTLADFLSSKLYQIQFEKTQSHNVTIDNQTFVILPYKFTFAFENQKSNKMQLEALQEQAAVVGSIASLGAGSSPVANDVV